MSSTLAVSQHDSQSHQRTRNALSSAPSPNDGESSSPHTLQPLETPDASSSILSYPSDHEEDPFFGFGHDPNNPEGLPSLLDEDIAWQQSFSFASTNPHPQVETLRNGLEESYPMTPDQTASIHTASPRSEYRTTVMQPSAAMLPTSISPRELQKPFSSQQMNTQTSQLTPSQSSSARSSEDGLRPAQMPMQATSPRVTVSVYDHDQPEPTYTIERSFADDGTATARGSPLDLAGDLASAGSTNPAPASQAQAKWHHAREEQRGGVLPHQRTHEELDTSINEMAKQRDQSERNEEVHKWISGNVDDVTSSPTEMTDAEIRNVESKARDENDNISLRYDSENRCIPGVPYISANGGPLNDNDRDIIASARIYGNAPMLHEITKPTDKRRQPETAHEAMRRFQETCNDAESILSRQATWGTRRRSFQDLSDFDKDGFLQGNLFKKLSIKSSTKENKRGGGLLNEIRGRIARSPSISSIRKRRNSNASNASNDGNQDGGPALEKKDSASSSHLAPPDRTSSWGKNNKRPSIDTAFVSMSTGAAIVGARHARQGSVGAGSGTSRSGLLGSLKVENTLKRARSKSELPRPTPMSPDSAESHPTLTSMWRASGGPPVAPVTPVPVAEPSIPDAPAVRPQAALGDADADEDEDDEDDLQDDHDMSADANLIDTFPPNHAGFRSHLLMLNPEMEHQHSYLVDRIAHQQVVRYKNLVNLKVKHMRMGTQCPCKSLCVAMGGQARLLDQKGGSGGLNGLHDEDDDTPTEGAVNQDSFPTDIPMPPTQYLPAEFECQLCFSRKKFIKPSDWTKHVHEDVQPFTCTWDRCKDAKSFKRKADWVRHENEGHRHLEWWACDVEECSHICYRRDNFLQHLVREHKFQEPKVKTKAAQKKAAGGDPTWRKVDNCYAKTTRLAQNEPCRFCGKTFPAWKKLTVHMAKHMEQISLPILRLLAAKSGEISADTLVSPIQDPPPQQSFNVPLDTQAAYPVAYDREPMQMHHAAAGYQDPSAYTNGMYATFPPAQHYPQNSYYNAHLNNVAQPFQQPSSGMATAMQQGYHLPPSSGASSSFVPTSQYVPAPNHNIDTGLEPFPQLPDDFGPGFEPHDATNSHLGPQMGYNMMDPSTATASPFSGHGSASPYMASPLQRADNNWDDGYMSGY